MYRRERKTEEGSRVGEKGIWPSPKERGGGGEARSLEANSSSCSQLSPTD